MFTRFRGPPLKGKSEVAAPAMSATDSSRGGAFVGLVRNRLGLPKFTPFRRKRKLRGKAFFLGKEFREEDHPRGEDGRFGEGGERESTPKKPAKKPSPMQEAARKAVAGKIRPVKERAFQGQPVEASKISKQLAGAIGEEIILLKSKMDGFDDAQPFSDFMDSDNNNLPTDAIRDHEALEIKAGQVSNGKGAQQWRLTIGEPGEKEKEWLKTASAEEKAAHNEMKMKAIRDRKKQALAAASAKLGKEVKIKEMTVIINPDTRTADVYEFDDVHERISWTSDEAEKAYVGSYAYGGD